jgi:hypothetical protein
LSELKVTDAVRLRSLVKIAIDRGLVKWSAEGTFRIGDRELCKVPVGEINNREMYL